MSEIKIVLITGGDGYIGSNLSNQFKRNGFTVWAGVQSKEPKQGQITLDICDPVNVKAVISKIRPDLVIHTAGLSSLAQCEKDRSLAFQVNVLGTNNIVDALSDKTKFVFLSSDYVFDGEKGEYTESSKTRPKTIYGQNKVAAEKYIKDKLKNYIIIRTANVYGNGGGNFYKFVCESLKDSQANDFFTDVCFTPTYINYLLFAIDCLVKREFRGTIHVAGQDKVSRYDFALAIATAGNFKSELVRPVKQPEDGLISRNSSLDTSKSMDILPGSQPSMTACLNLEFGNTTRPYFQFCDQRGMIQGISQSKTWREINYIESEEGVTRGGHYHKKTIEGFYVIDGKIEVAISDLKSNKSRVFTVGPGEIFTVNPNLIHTFLVKNQSRWINMLSTSMDKEPKDIHIVK